MFFFSLKGKTEEKASDAHGCVAWAISPNNPVHLMEISSISVTLNYNNRKILNKLTWDRKSKIMQLSIPFYVGTKYVFKIFTLTINKKIKCFKNSCDAVLGLKLRGCTRLRGFSNLKI